MRYVQQKEFKVEVIMPYISPGRRVDLKLATFPENVGELNFCLTQVVLRYEEFQRRFAPLDKSRRGYELFNDVIGALESAKMEIYRRLVAPYEDGKILENGDVF